MTHAGATKVLFVAYGSGHIKMVIPVAQALAASGKAAPVVLALTTAATVAQAAGLDVLHAKGLEYNPVTRRYWLSANTSVNYMLATQKFS